MNMQMESFYEGARNADILIYNSAIDGELQTVDQLLEKSGVLADFKAVREGNVWCTGKNLFQESLGLGDLITDLHTVLSGEDGVQVRDQVPEAQALLKEVFPGAPDVSLPHGFKVRQNAALFQQLVHSLQLAVDGAVVDQYVGVPGTLVKGLHLHVHGGFGSLLAL